MKISELIEKSGVPRTTIHYYQRLGLLPAAEKRSKNSALYDQRHLDRLKLITRLRSEAGGSYTIDRIQAIIAELDNGSEKALSEVLSGGDRSGRQRLSPADLALRTGLRQEVVNQLIRENVIRYRPDDSMYDERDVAALDAIAGLLEMGIELEAIVPIARVVEKLAAFEIDQYTKVRNSLSPASRREFLLNLQQATDSLHEYLFNRIRQHLLDKRGSGIG